MGTAGGGLMAFPTMTPAPDLADVLRYVAPPLPVVALLRENADRLTPDGAAWLLRWEAIRAGDPVPVLDRFGK